MTTKPPVVRCVVDANVAVQKFIMEPRSAKAALLLNALDNPASALHVPDFFLVEIASVLWKATRDGRISIKLASEAMSLLGALLFTVAPTQGLSEKAFQIATRHTISPYDACYVALSARTRLPLITEDVRLVNALRGSEFDVRTFESFAI